jgi:preprotein translocase subunit SecA
MDRMGMEEGEVIQHSMITSSIERAQKKVEENNFGVRKRLLEYDDVMNSQREVIYRRRRNALYGERLELDIQNIVYQSIAEAAASNPGRENAERFHLRLVHLFGYNPSTEGLDLAKLKSTEIAGKLYPDVSSHYRAHIEQLAEKTLRVINQIVAQHGPQPYPVGLPFQTPKVGMQVPIDADEAAEHGPRAVRHGLERFSTLAMIDQAWKEHLREMDELRQSVQNASLEQKDPLLVYKFEAVKLFRSFLSDVNEQIISFLFRAELPELQIESNAPQMPARVPQIPAPQGATAGQEVHNELDGLLNALRAQAAGPQNETAVLDEESMEAARPKPQPIRAAAAPNRNDKVTVRYFATGEVKQVKFKAVEEDVKRGLCMVVDMA